MAIKIGRQEINEFFGAISGFNFESLVNACKEVPSGTYDEAAIISALVNKLSGENPKSSKQNLIERAAEIVCTLAALSVYGATEAKIRSNGSGDAIKLLDEFSKYATAISRMSSKTVKRTALTYSRAAGMAAHVPLTIHMTRTVSVQMQFVVPNMERMEKHYCILKPNLPSVMGDKWGPKGKALCLMVAGIWSAIFSPTVVTDPEVVLLIKRTAAATSMQFQRSCTTQQLSEAIKTMLSDWKVDLEGELSASKELEWVNFGVNVARPDRMKPSTSS